MAQAAKVLIIEDEADFLRIYSDLLSSKGYQVLQAADGQSGMEAIIADGPDVVLLDLILPELSGFEILERVRQTPEISNLPIIIFSVLGDQDKINKALQLGANDYAVKGFSSPAEILRKIESALMHKEKGLALNSYRIGLKPTQYSILEFMKDSGLTRGLVCPSCEEEIIMELMPDYTRTQEHWYFAHLICSRCQLKL
jgi:DNA-binding response OmpR family regulator